MTLRHKIRTIAIVLTVGYTLARFFFVGSFLQGYGVNPWLFLLIDGPSGVAYVLCIEYLVVSLKPGGRLAAWQKLVGAGVVAVVAFGAPYLYIYLSSRELPTTVALGLGAIVILLLLNALVAFNKRVRRVKHE